MLQNGGQKVPKSGPGPPRTALGGRSENPSKNVQNLSPNGSQNGGQMGDKFDEKRCPKTGSTPRGVPGSPREPYGTILGAILEHFRAFFHVSPSVFTFFFSCKSVFSRVFVQFSLGSFVQFRKGRFSDFSWKVLGAGLQKER